MGRCLRIACNACDLVLRDGVRSWLRGLRAVAPAMGTLFVVLLLAGSSALAGFAARHVLAAELREASAVRVYLRQEASAEDVDSLRRRLEADGRVTGVRFVSADQALEHALERPGLARLADAAGSNPFPARLEVRVAALSEVAGVVSGLTGDPAVDPADPTSYDPGTYADLQRLLRIAGATGAALLAVLALVAAAVTANAVRSAVRARDEELATMRLLGAGRLVLWGPFVVEGALTGAAAGLLAAALLLGLFAGAEQVSARMFTALLPGVNWTVAALTAAALPAAGSALGSLGTLGGLGGRAA